MMKRSLMLIAAMLLVTGCSSKMKKLGTAEEPRYVYTIDGAVLIVSPIPTQDADLSRPELSGKGNTITVSGQVRLRTDRRSPMSAVRIVITNSSGKTTHDMRAVLNPAGTPGVFAYRAHFSPMPSDGSAIVITYAE